MARLSRAALSKAGEAGWGLLFVLMVDLRFHRRTPLRSPDKTRLELRPSCEGGEVLTRVEEMNLLYIRLPPRGGPLDRRGMAAYQSRLVTP